MEDITRAELIAIVRRQDETIRELRTENAYLHARVESLTEELETMHFRVNQMSRRIFGNVSERFAEHDDQQWIPGLGPSVGDESFLIGDLDDDKEENKESTPESALPKKRDAAKRGGRLVLPDHLPLVEQTIEPEPSALIDANGRVLVKLRTETTEKLDYVAGGFRRIRIHRPVYGIPQSDDCTVTAEPPEQIVAKGVPTDATVAMVLCDKFDLHNPLYRQTSRFQRAGLSIGRGTLSHWITKACSFLTPLVTAIEKEVLAEPVIHCDDTTIQRLTPGKGSTHTARFWGYLGTTACVVRYSENRSAQNPIEFLSPWSGTIVADAYGAHEILYRDQCMPKKHAPCLLHVRRKFYEAWKDAGDSRAGPVLTIFKQLYAIEKILDQQTASHVNRQRKRQHESQPLLHQMHALVQKLTLLSTPKSPLGKACRYFNNLWARIPTFIDDGRIPIDNNPLERLWKPVALGRTNYLFVGNDDGGDRAAIAYTITLTCKMHGIDPYLYLTNIIPDLHRGINPKNCTPVVWAKQNNAAFSAATHAA